MSLVLQHGHRAGLETDTLLCLIDVVNTSLLNNTVPYTQAPYTGPSDACSRSGYAWEGELVDLDVGHETSQLVQSVLSQYSKHIQGKEGEDVA